MPNLSSPLQLAAFSRKLCHFPLEIPSSESSWSIWSPHCNTHWGGGLLLLLLVDSSDMLVWTQLILLLNSWDVMWWLISCSGSRWSFASRNPMILWQNKQHNYYNSKKLQNFGRWDIFKYSIWPLAAILNFMLKITAKWENNHWNWILVIKLFKKTTLISCLEVILLKSYVFYSRIL